MRRTNEPRAGNSYERSELELDAESLRAGEKRIRGASQDLEHDYEKGVPRL
jgi:hypothetical protein